MPDFQAFIGAVAQRVSNELIDKGRRMLSTNGKLSEAEQLALVVSNAICAEANGLKVVSRVEDDEFIELDESLHSRIEQAFADKVHDLNRRLETATQNLAASDAHVRELKHHVQVREEATRIAVREREELRAKLDESELIAENCRVAYAQSLEKRVALESELAAERRESERLRAELERMTDAAQRMQLITDLLKENEG